MALVADTALNLHSLTHWLNDWCDNNLNDFMEKKQHVPNQVPIVNVNIKNFTNY